MKNNYLQQWLDKCATFSLPGAGVSRYFLTAEHRALIEFLKDRMLESGLQVTLDHAGNLIGRKSSSRSGKIMYLGSHQDSVPNGGRYDGILGILVALAALYELRDIDLGYSVELLAFGDEEGTRFQTTLIGSSAIAGCFDPAALLATDDEGQTLESALTDFGLNPAKISDLTRSPEQALGYVEVHIEQGPILEEKGQALGLVSSITGIDRYQIQINGKAGHAGTVPMHLRKDALVAASEYISWVNEHCLGHENLVGVVGKILVEPNAVNVIPENVDFTVELRSPEKSIRLRAKEELLKRVKQTEKQGFKVDFQQTYSMDSVHCDQHLSSQLRAAFTRENIPPIDLFSGAGHDALAMSRLCPVAMVFVRSTDGLSHHPDEHSSSEDIDIAKKVLKSYLLNFKLSI